MRQLNLVFLMVMVVGMVLLGGGMHLVHEFQVRRNASALLESAHRAETDKQVGKAEKALGWYLSLRPDDAAVWAWYARLVDQGDPERRRIERSYLVYEQALRHAPDDRELKRRCADLAMEMHRFADAKSLLGELIEPVSGDSQGTPEAAARAELEDLLGQCHYGLGEHGEAEKSFKAAFAYDPHRVDAYNRLARLQRPELHQEAAGDETIGTMVANNIDSGRAYAIRWQYAREYARPAGPKELKKLEMDLSRDLEQALAKAPDDREVLVAAVLASEQRRDTASVRSYLEKGCRLDPGDLFFAIGLARLEKKERHLDRAEAVLRRAFEAKPNAALAFELADNLILQKKFDGRNGAADLLTRLRAAGLGDTLVRFLEAEILFVQDDKLAEAIKELEGARTVLEADSELKVRTEVMLAECYGRQSPDKQLEILRQAASGDRGAGAARREMILELARSGEFDQAMALAGDNPLWRLDLVQIELQKTIRLPRDRRNWAEVEEHLDEAGKALPGSAERVVLLRLEILAAQGRLEEARTLLSQALAREPGKLGYRLAMARLTQRQGRDDEALRIIDQAEKDLGASSQIALARLDYWGQRGGDAARNAVARLAAARGQVPAADRPAFLDRLGAVAVRLGRRDLARQYWREQAVLQPDNLQVRLGLFDLAVMAGDRDEAGGIVEVIHEIDSKEGNNWRFVRAALLIDQASRGHSEGLEEARGLAAEITKRRPNWWVGPALNGEIAELARSVDQAIGFYMRALELGNVQPSVARRLVLLLDQQGRRDEVDRVMEVLHDQGAALSEVILVQALDALRKRDYDRSITLARQVFADSSPNAADHLNLGRIYQAAGRGNEAGREFHRAVELGRGVPENWLAYVQFLVQAKQPDQAKAVVEAAAKALPRDRATLTLAQCALMLGDTAGAEALIKQAMDAEGKADDLLTLRVAVDVNLRLNHFDVARSYLDRVAGSPAASPADKAWTNRTRAALLVATNRQADRDRALALLDRNLADAPESVEDQSLKAAILALRPARRGEAIAILERLAGTNRLSDDQRFRLAQLRLGEGQGAKYEDEMLGLLNRKDKSPRHLAHFVNHWIGRNQLDQADRWLAELKQADPRGLPALELETRLLDLRKRKPELLALLQAHGREVPDQIGAVADLLNRYGFAKEAEEAYKAFVARDPNQPERVLALAQFLGRQDRVPEAMELFKKAWSTCRPEQVATAALSVFDAASTTDLQRRQVEAWLTESVRKRPEATILGARLGVIWIREGRFDDAERLFRRLLASHPDNVDVLNSLAWIVAMRDPGKAGDALELINQAIEIQGPNASLLDTRAVVLIRSGQPGRAAQDLREARKLNPKNPSPVLHLAWAYQMSGQLDEAKQVFRQAGELGWRVAKSDPLERELMEKLRQYLGLVAN